MERSKIMAMKRVWNITDDANSKVKPHNRMVLGKILKPGQAVQVDEARLARAHKVHKDEAAGYLHIGPRPPASYQAVKRPPRAKADARRVDENGNYVGNKPIAPDHAHPRKLVVELTDEVEATDEAEAELHSEEELSEEEATTEEEDEDEETEADGEEIKSGRRRRRK
jgi:hypothetical protein